MIELPDSYLDAWTLGHVPNREHVLVLLPPLSNHIILFKRNKLLLAIDEDSDKLISIGIKQFKSKHPFIPETTFRWSVLANTVQLDVLRRVLNAMVITT